MKGIVFKVFESFVEDNWGAVAYEEILENTTLQTQGPFLGPETYPDEDLLALVQTAIAKLQVPLPDALRAFGKYLFPKLNLGFPEFAAAYSCSREFLRNVEAAIHVEVRKLFPEAYVPTFSYEEPSPDKLVIDYHSKRQLCALMEGLIEGVAEHFGQKIEWQQSTCVHRGDSRCRFELEFEHLSQKAAS